MSTLFDFIFHNNILMKNKNIFDCMKPFQGVNYQRIVWAVRPFQNHKEAE